MNALIPPGKVVDGWSWRFDGRVRRYRSDRVVDERAMVCKASYELLLTMWRRH